MMFTSRTYNSSTTGRHQALELNRYIWMYIKISAVYFHRVEIIGIAFKVLTNIGPTGQ